MAKLPIYKVVLTDEDGMDFNSFVDYPAHSKSFELFNGQKQPIKQLFNDEKRIVTGVAISANQPIYRVDDKGREYYLYFSPETIQEIAKRASAKGYLHNVNFNHNGKDVAKGVTLIESYFIDRKRGVNPPTAFENQNLQDGSWIVSYKIDNQTTWSKLKSGEFQGFSVEVYLSLEKVNFKNNTNMKKSIFEKIKAIFEEDGGEQPPVQFGEATTTDGVNIKWSGELAEGTVITMVAEDGEEILAPEGTHSIANEDGTTTVVTLDASGIVTSIEVVAEEEVTVEEVMEEVATKMSAQKAEIKVVKDELAKLKEAFAKLESAVSGKSTPAKVDTKVSGYKSLLNN